MLDEFDPIERNLGGARIADLDVVWMGSTLVGEAADIDCDRFGDLESGLPIVDGESMQARELPRQRGAGALWEFDEFAAKV